MKNRKYHTFGTVPKSNRKSLKGSKSILLTHKYIFDRSLSWLCTGTSITSGRVKCFMAPNLLS
jgi:hypothetical protein